MIILLQLHSFDGKVQPKVPKSSKRLKTLNFSTKFQFFFNFRQFNFGSPKIPLTLPPTFLSVGEVPESGWRRLSIASSTRYESLGLGLGLLSKVYNARSNFPSYSRIAFNLGTRQPSSHHSPYMSRRDEALGIHDQTRVPLCLDQH